jgi:Domain of unknown function (DUF4112)
MKKEDKKPEQSPELVWVEKLVSLMDGAFRIPGTNIRFGIDPLLGLVPGLGETISYVISGLLLLAMVRQGASWKTAFQMVMNITLDYLVGSVPLAGDLFDVAFKANTRNLQLLKKQPLAKGKGANVFLLMLVVFVVLVVVLVAGVFLLWKLFEWLWS